MLRIFKLAYDAALNAQSQRATTRLMQELDERTLRDIGLEAEANAARERTRIVRRFGAY